ncbi:hypothetical protein DKX38_017737 [Salix brachista]|uniref:MLO-like protein n=1 Tax=Salix brachista TaxID=2182728 RepID=A0A5N5KWY5_9ROSI|nr:hypothetical protein DKX38_017737 [Salix brachista]
MRLLRMEEETNEMRSLALTPTWSVATVLTIFVVVSLIVERSIHRLCNTKREELPPRESLARMLEFLWVVRNVLAAQKRSRLEREASGKGGVGSETLEARFSGEVGKLLSWINGCRRVDAELELQENEDSCCLKEGRSEECHTSEDESIKIEDDADEEQAASEIAIQKSRGSASDARLAAAHEQMRSAEEDAAEWKWKYDIAVRKTKAALEKAANVQERTNKETQLREDALREEFSSHLVVKEDEIKEKNRRIEYAEQCLTTSNLELKAAESKMQSYGTEISSLKLEIKVLVEKLETANAKAQSYDKEARILEQEKIHLEQRYQSEFERFAEVQERCNRSEKECKRATELADRARADAVSAQKKKSEFQKLEIERLAQIERAQRHVESLYSDWDLLPPKIIKDPEAKKPEDWDDKEYIPNPEDKKPEGYEDIPKEIPDPDAKKPEDWDDEEDGEWTAPTISNHEYKGPWKPKKIKNPNYQGKWKAPIWLRETKQKPLLATVEKMKEELMLLGFISLLLTATSSIISTICIPSKFYGGHFATCTRPEFDEGVKHNSSEGRKLEMLSVLPHPLRRMLNGLDSNPCEKAFLERLHRFIFVMAITHICYSCLTVLLAIVKIHSWRAWEDLARMDCHDPFTEINREKTLRRQTTFVRHHASSPLFKNSFLIWVVRTKLSFLLFNAFYVVIYACFLLTLTNSAIKLEFSHEALFLCSSSSDVLSLCHPTSPKRILAPIPRAPPYMFLSAIWTFGGSHRLPYSSPGLHLGMLFCYLSAHYINYASSLTSITFVSSCSWQNHSLQLDYDFHSYMIRSMEEEFHRIVGVSVPLWGFVVAFMLFNVEGSNLYFWISVVPITLVLLLGAKLQHVIAILTLETAGLTEHSEVGKLKPRDDLFWFKKPELFLPLIHFILFQWQFGYKSCFIRSHFLVYIRLVLGFAGQFLCSYSTLPLYALVTQMGTKYKAALIPQIIRETLLGLGKAARRKTRDGIFTDDPTMHTDTRTVMFEEENHHLLDIPENDAVPATQIEFQPASFIPASPTTVANETSCRAATRFLRPSASVPSSERSNFHVEDMPRSSSMPVRK